MMNLQRHLSLIIISLFTTLSVQAAPVDSTFTTGDTLTAEKMTEIKDAVTDNDTRIGATETQTQNLADGCPAGQSIQAIALDGTLTCEVDDSGSSNITGVTAGTGLSGGGTTGDVTLNVDTTQVQTRVTGSCPAGQSIRVIDATGAVTCEVDTDTDTNTTYSAGAGLVLTGTTFSATNTGDITAVTAGTGLSDGGTTGDVTLNVDPAQVQTRVSSAGCPAGQSIRVINEDGSVTCEADTDTTYTAGTGIDITGATISVALPVQTYSEYYSGSFFERVTNGSTTENNIRKHAYYAYAWADVAGTQYLNYPLHLPQDSVVNDLTCYYYDNDATLNFTSINQRILLNPLGPIEASSFEDHFYLTSSTTTQSTSITSFTSPTENLTIDNANNAYRIYIWENSFGGSTNLRFYGCKVTYQK